MKISFLIHNGYGIGGTIRTTFNLAMALAERHDVEIVSVLRHREKPVFALDPRVRITHLVDLRHEKDHPKHRTPAKVFPVSESRYGQYSALTDERIAAHLRSTSADVVVGTRPGLNIHLALEAPKRLVRVAQEHLTLDSHPPKLRGDLRRVYPVLDALTTVTEADAAAFRRQMRLPGVRIEALPNSIPAPGIEPVDGSSRHVIAAGRLVKMKRYDLLIEAFAKVVAERPDWKLRIYGNGDERDRLKQLIGDLGLYNHVFLMGAASPIEAEWAKGSICAVTSEFESFGMTIVEAMRCGLAVVSADCPLGPPEIIEDGVDGLLVRSGDKDAMADALLRLTGDEELRRRLGTAARQSAARFDPVSVAARCERLFTELTQARQGSRGRLTTLHRRLGGALVSGGFAAKDTAHAAAQSSLAVVRKRRGR